MSRAEALRNIARNATRPNYFPVMARKVAARLHPSHRDAAVRWAASVAEDLPRFATGLDSDLWAEAEEWGREFRSRARARLEALGVELGGGGHFQLVYFLVRHLRPKVVLETGVAAGWTSSAILSALERNGGGALYSSDFPYFRLEQPERYVGCLVEDRLRADWHLGLKGDRANLAEFLPQVDRIDFVHYDSDKTADGRAFALEAIAPKLGSNAPVMMDDIDDNTFFRDYAARVTAPTRVFARGRKYVGLVGL
jgi:predicted O-methyltransferase YrrM